MIFSLICDKIIEYSFYLIFFLVPLLFLNNTSEFFEFNKLWLVFGMTAIIGAAWICKMIIDKKFIIRRTPLDIPILLFLASQIISTVFSVDPHISFWGHYGRFNGGLLSTFAYIILYYGFVSNLGVKHVIRIIFLSLVAGILTILWGLPSHFGYDPTCLLYTGSLDTKCWFGDYRPIVRIFSTLGQPTWFAAYLSVVLPLLMAYILISALKEKKKSIVVYFAASILGYLCLIFANARAGMLSFYITDAIFWMILIYKRIFNFKELSKYFLALHIGFAVCTFFYGSPVSSINNFSLSALQNRLVAYAKEQNSELAGETAARLMGITDSWEIRKLIWRGAIEAWKASPLTGSGVQTFEYDYHKYRPAEHNLTSEWDNTTDEAHNEYLNYLATTGIIGLGSYLLFLAVFIIYSVRYLFNKKDIVTQYIQNSGLKPGVSDKTREAYIQFLLIAALFCSFLSILITNFFGFSVITTSLYLFFIPAFFLFLSRKFKNENKHSVDLGTNVRKDQPPLHLAQWIAIGIVIIIALYMHVELFRYWYADSLYEERYKLNQQKNFQEAYKKLAEAVKLEPAEPVYKSELALDLSQAAAMYYLQKEDAKAKQLAEMAIELNSEVVRDHPNIVAFWENRFKIFAYLADSDIKQKAKYYEEALIALKKLRELAPANASNAYILSIALLHMGQADEAEAELKEAIKLKPDYYDAYDRLGKLYHRLALDDKTRVASISGRETIADSQMQQKAIDIYRQYLTSPYYKASLRKQGKAGW